MKGELDFQKYSVCSGQGLFADNVILSLLDFVENGALDTKGRAILKRAKGFLDDAIVGGNLQNSVFSSAHDLDAAKAFYAVEKVEVPRSRTINEYIRLLSNIVEKILGDNPVTNDEIVILDKFFSSYGQINYQRSKEILEAV